jgi:hypothetical protein
LAKWIKYIRPESIRDRSEEPEVSLWKTGKISFPKVSVDLYRMHEYKYIKLYFRKDKGGNWVGVELTNNRDQAKEIFAITKAKTNTVVSANMFFIDNGINISATKRYPLLEENSLLVFGPVK